jgi:xylan 1,4-beta-xylosidase
MNASVIQLDPASPGPCLSRPWKNCIAVGRAYDLLRADLQAHLAWLQREIGFRSCRFHAIFHDDVGVVRRDADGALVYQWHQLDKIYDALLGLGLKPFVELNPMPAALASGSQTMFHYRMNVTPPARWSEWYDLVRAFTLHCVERYGLPEVRSWHFEVWNEPNLSGFWSGTKEDYFQLYAHAARAVKSVDANLQVGGPASSKAYWLNDLISYCHREKVPIDFISTHLYPQDEFVEFADRAASPHAPGAFFQDTVRAAATTVANSALPHLPIHWTEWNTQLATGAVDVTWGNNRYVDSLHGAAFVARQMTELDDAAATFAYWVASDIFEEGPIPHAPFSHTYGLLTIHGLPKAHANAFRLLERLRGPRIGLKTATHFPKFCGGVATQEGESIHVLLWHDVPPEVGDASPWSVRVQLPLAHEPKATWLATTSHIRAHAGSPFETWEQMGSPLNLSSSQLAMLRQHAEPATTCRPLRGDQGALELEVMLAPHEVMHIEFRPARGAGTAPEPASSSAATLQLEAMLGEKSRL